MGVKGFPSSLFLVLAFSSCTIVPVPEPPPVRYLRMEVVVDHRLDPRGEGPATSRKGLPALYARIENTCDTAIVEMTAVFALYDTDGRPVPAAGGNRFRWKSTAELPPNTVREFYIPLDAVFHYVPETPPVVDRFHLQNVRFADGSTWEDPLASYAWTGAGEPGGRDGKQKEAEYEN
jgi:hypothetical protein